MAFQFRMEKVLSVKEKEKEKLEAEYNAALHVFEEAAEELLTLLRKKEEIEAHRKEQFYQKMMINDLQNTQRYLLSMTNKILGLQERVQRARELMNYAQQKLVNKTIEVKTYEKLKDKQRKEYEWNAVQQENRQNDEFSILRFAGTRN